MWGRGQRVLQIISLNTLVDVIRVAKTPTSGESIDKIFVSICTRSTEESRQNCIRKEDLEVKYYYDEEPQEFPVFVGLHKWTSSA